eukprot:XP_011605656.1 PREDICTED: pro-neuregulin-4, membrane-bound isoform isoform X1 [Takifugu rubripes]
MMADHGDLCEGVDTAYCMNGGTCYKITFMDTLTCVCNSNYKGSRCEQFQLFSSSTSAERAGLIAAMVVVALFISVSLAVIIYYDVKSQEKEATEHPATVLEGQTQSMIPVLALLLCGKSHWTYWSHYCIRLGLINKQEEAAG